MRRTARTSGRPEPEILGQYLRYLRERAGLSQRELAERLGRKDMHMFVWRIETGAMQVDLPTLLDVADALGVDVIGIVVHVREEARKIQGES